MAEDNKEDYYAGVVRAVKENLYVDDMAASKGIVTEGIELVTDLPEMTEKGGFRLTKFISNSPEVMAVVPPEDRASSVKGLDFSDYSCTTGFPVERTLGVHWDVKTVQFICRVVTSCETPTKRNILKVVARTFDPLGIFSPFLLPAHQIFQELCRQKLAWDQTFEGDLHDRWLSWLKDFEVLTDFRMIRCLLALEKLKMFSCISSLTLPKRQVMAISGLSTRRERYMLLCS
jgi:hypothetical protein